MLIVVILAVGFRPNTSFAAGKVELFKNGAFVDKKQETSLPGVYAIGDCATIYNNASLRNGLYRLCFKWQ